MMWSRLRERTNTLFFKSHTFDIQAKFIAGFTVFKARNN